MCGIIGLIRKQANKEQLQSVLTNMNELIYHRGPDDKGYFIDCTKENQSIGMAMRRLSIIDLNSGVQPIYNHDKSIVILYNGEIYNYLKLKSDLEADGVEFNTKSDTEVILKLYETRGEKSFQELDGMYAFSIYDANKNMVFIARDFFGEKPLYYHKNESGLVWASELKCIINELPQKPEISKFGLNLFFKLTYIPAPYTIYEDVFKLRPNHYIAYNLSTHEFDIHETGLLNYKKSNSLSFDNAKKKLNSLVMESIESRSISDVPLGTFLSGGVDSSIVSFGLSKLSDLPIDTFSIGFEKASFDETKKSQLVAKLINSNHHEYKISENDIKEHLDDILLNFDEPFADSSALPTYIVSQKARSHVKVALTGDGGDEVFGGYNKYFIGKLNTKYTNVIPEFLHKGLKETVTKLLSTSDDKRGKRFKFKKLVNAIDYNDNNYWDIISLGFGRDTNLLLNSNYRISNVFDYYKSISKISKPKTLQDYRDIDRHLSLEGDLLVKVDRTSMLNSLECRSPFLNKSLWEFSSSLPDNYLLRGWNKKYILKEAFKHEFPNGFLDKSKKGFVVPVGDWLRDGLRPELETYIDTLFLEKQDIFNIDYIKNIISNHLNGKEDNSYQAWAFYTFQKWYCHVYTKFKL